MTVSVMPEKSSVSAPVQAKRKAIREIVPIYWRRLIEVGVPINAAKIIAWAIARYDAARKVPSPAQQLLIRHYCRFVCRAELWRPKLLMSENATVNAPAFL